MGVRPSPEIVETLRKVLRELEETSAPQESALVSLKKIILNRIADIELADAAEELVDPPILP